MHVVFTSTHTSTLCACVCVPLCVVCWDLLQDIFGHVTTDSSQRGLHFMFYAYHGISGGAVLAALVAGDAAVSLEHLSEEQAVSDVMQLLRSVFTAQGVVVPEPLQVGDIEVCS